jgi:hypothetical protein
LNEQIEIGFAISDDEFQMLSEALESTAISHPTA